MTHLVRAHDSDLWAEEIVIVSGDLGRAPLETQPREAFMSILAKILYIASALRARPRAIDRYIDYFGDRVPDRR